MKNTKNLLFVLGILFILVSTNFISSEEINYSYSATYGGVQITSLKYEPYPANPGEYFDVWLQVNIGSSTNYAKIEFVENFPFSLDSNEETIRVYEDFSGEVVLHYKIRVDEDAVEGTNELKFEITSARYSDTSSIYSLDIYVDNAQTDFDLVVQDSTSSEISLAIANIGKNTANSMIVKIPEQEGYKTSGTNGQMVGNLDSGDYTIVSFEVSQIGRNENLLQIQIDYTDNIGERRSVLKEIDIGSGNVFEVSDFNEGEIPEGFEGMPGMGNFPRQQQKSKWPYFLAGAIILIVLGFIIYSKNPKKFKTFFINLKKKKEKVIEKKSNPFPDWMNNENEKTKKR